MVRVDSKGRIVLPSEIRERLGLRPGSVVEVNTDDGRAVVEPEDPPEQVMEDLEELIEAAAANRARRREAEGLGVGRDGDSIAAKQRDVIRRGAQSKSAHRNDAG